MTDKKKQRGAGIAAVFGRKLDSMPVSQHDGVPEIQHTVMATEKQKPIKATYYIDPALIKRLKYLSVERNADLSSLVNEAIRDLVDRA